jgi:hypothetical protein
MKVEGSQKVVATNNVQTTLSDIRRHYKSDMAGHGWFTNITAHRLPV